MKWSTVQNFGFGMTPFESGMAYAKPAVPPWFVNEVRHVSAGVPRNANNVGSVTLNALI